MPDIIAKLWGQAPIVREGSLTREELADIEIAKTQSLAKLADAVSDIACFLNNGGLSTLLQGYARANSINGILQGLAAHDGRNALDARVLSQNSLEIVEQIQRAYAKMHERVTEKEPRDPEIHDAQKGYDEWKSKLEENKK